MSRTLISIDLDWFNGELNPLDKLRELLLYIPKTIPVIMTVEHHEFLPQLRQWIKSGKIKTPFDIINIDEHHDYYTPLHNHKTTEINCGNWGFRLPLEWYDSYTWVYNSEREYCDWEEAKVWLNEHGIKHSVRDQHRLKSLKSEIIAAIFCVSPDYLCPFMEEDDKISDAIEIIVKHFGMKIAPLRIINGQAHKLNGWRMAPRPVKVK